MDIKLGHQVIVAEREEHGYDEFRWECRCVRNGKRVNGSWTTSKAAAERNGRQHETRGNAATAQPRKFKALTSLLTLKF